MEHSPGSQPSSESSGISSNSVYPPGTPRPPFEPPRRRSSLFFSRAVHQSPETPASASKHDVEGAKSGTRGTMPNTGRKRIPSSLTKSIVSPGHVAQMQRLFQHAKASLRLDVRFASSPVGSIDSRLPTSPQDGTDANVGTNKVGEASEDRKETPSKNWRYSKAPNFLVGSDMDVREPFPESSPQLPRMPPFDPNNGNVPDAEPPSSGFTSPLLRESFEPGGVLDPVLSSPPPSRGVGRSFEQDDKSAWDGEVASNDLEHPLTKLRLNNDHNMDLDSMDDSPIISHLKRKSVDVEDKYKDSSSGSEQKIVLSPSAKAAADSAKLKRGMFSDLFPKPPTHMGSSEGTASSSKESRQTNKQCPDPLLHEGGPAVRCPDPTAHFASHLPHPANPGGLAVTPNVHSTQHTVPSALNHPATHFNRATATGSPMPLLKFKPPQPPSAGAMRHGVWHPSPGSSTRSRPHPQHRPPLNPPYFSTRSEHFRPGWYYAKDSPQSSPRRGPAMYSFSTAAGKVDGHDPAPDSMIRDSYRTDTLTPLAKPPSRFRKNGMSAIASAQGAGKHYKGPSYLSRPPQRRMHAARSRLPDSLQFRSSPPRSSTDSYRPPPPRKRTLDLVSPTTDILEEGTSEKMPLDPRLRLEEGEEVIKVDEETRAAVRMSLFGTATPETGSDAGGGLQDLSPNVMLYRKGTGPSGSRKKRRPSYWDGDLEEVVRSSAARRIVSSPIKKDDVRSLQADVEFQDEYADKENQVPEDDAEVQDVSMIAEGPTILQEDVSMANEDLNGLHQYY